MLHNVMYKLQSAPKMIFLRAPRKPCTVTVQHYILEAAMALDVALIRNSDAAVIRAETTSQMRVSTSANLTKCFKLFIPGNSASARHDCDHSTIHCVDHQFRLCCRHHKSGIWFRWLLAWLHTCSNGVSLHSS